MTFISFSVLAEVSSVGTKEKPRCAGVPKEAWENNYRRCKEPFIKDPANINISPNFYESVCSCAADRFVYDLNCEDQEKMSDSAFGIKTIDRVMNECLEVVGLKFEPISKAGLKELQAYQALNTCYETFIGGSEDRNKSQGR